MPAISSHCVNQSAQLALIGASLMLAWCVKVRDITEPLGAISAILLAL